MTKQLLIIGLTRYRHCVTYIIMATMKRGTQIIRVHNAQEAVKAMRIIAATLSAKGRWQHA